MKTFRQKKGLLILSGIITAAILAFIISGIICNRSLRLSEYIIKAENLPTSFQGYRIAQVSDMHNRTQGKNNSNLLDILIESDPDIIVITGDMIDSRTTQVDIALDFAAKAVKIAPCYYVTGNHEARIPQDFEVLLAGLQNAGVKILRNESTKLEKSGEAVTLLGIDDPWFTSDGNNTPDADIVRSTLKNITPESRDTFTILLSHRPELFKVYAEFDIDLILSGHAHGGQIRLPFLGGLYAPDQGLLPSLEKGMFTKDNSCMIVSTGVGNSLFPLRIFNPPEVVLIELSK